MIIEKSTNLSKRLAKGERERLEILVSRFIEIAGWEDKARRYINILDELKGLEPIRYLGIEPRRPLNQEGRIAYAKRVDGIFKQLGLANKDPDIIKRTLLAGDGIIKIIDFLQRVGFVR